MMKQMGELNKPETELTASQKAALSKLKTDVYGSIHTEQIPIDLADELLRQKVGVPEHLWIDENIYSARRKGKLAAAQAFTNYRELVLRVQDVMKRNAEKVKRQQSKKAKSPSKKARTPRHTSRYRRRKR